MGGGGGNVLDVVNKCVRFFCVFLLTVCEEASGRFILQRMHYTSLY